MRHIWRTKLLCISLHLLHNFLLKSISIQGIMQQITHFFNDYLRLIKQGREYYSMICWESRNNASCFRLSFRENRIPLFPDKL
ncbi:MAG TPA: hypothetical protein DDW73_22240 [Rhizobium sp.]|nr:hypothetical protein [Rhizobium sp.]